MTGNEYQKLAARTIGTSDPIDTTRHGVFGLCAEAGEVAGLFQKIYQGHSLEIEHLKKELGDVLWMVAEICTANDFDFEDIMHLNIAKLINRYPDGFDAVRSKFRREDDI